jgi:hypothetical protein
MGARFAGGTPHSDAHSAVLPPLHRHVHRRAIPYRLVDHAITLGQLEELIELILRRVGFDREVPAATPDRITAARDTSAVAGFVPRYCRAASVR